MNGRQDHATELHIRRAVLHTKQRRKLADAMNDSEGGESQQNAGSLQKCGRNAHFAGPENPRQEFGTAVAFPLFGGSHRSGGTR